MGSLAAVGVVLSTQNVNSICTTTKALGNTNLALASTTTIPDATGNTQANINTVVAKIRTQFNAIENKINGYATPSC